MKTNNEGQFRYDYVSKNVIQMLVFTPIIYSFIIWLVYLSIGTKSILYFYSMLAWILAFLAVSFYSTLRQLKRQNRTISELDFLNEDIKINTNKILWLKAKEFRLNKTNLHFKNRKFDWYGKKTEKEGLSIFVNDIELYLVKDYFDEYDNVVKLLT